MPLKRSLLPLSRRWRCAPGQHVHAGRRFLRRAQLHRTARHRQRLAYAVRRHLAAYSSAKTHPSGRCKQPVTKCTFATIHSVVLIWRKRDEGYLRKQPAHRRPRVRDPAQGSALALECPARLSPGSTGVASHREITIAQVRRCLSDNRKLRANTGYWLPTQSTRPRSPHPFAQTLALGIATDHVYFKCKTKVCAARNPAVILPIGCNFSDLSARHRHFEKSGFVSPLITKHTHTT